MFHRRRALAYVAGAWARYGRDTEFRFANAEDKATLVGQLLTHLGCRDVWLKRSFESIPGANVVTFEPTEEVRRWLRGRQ